ncbi:ABC transporter ATP-binding protein [Thermoplasmatales archaeon AK]|nr:ABC transporter ATP-binding protein [Thermoplasmatales archaeon AK]
MLVQNLRKTYDNRKYAVNDLSFTVSEGEIYGLLGKNGAGKSTTIKILTTLIPPTSGKAEILGLDVTTRARKIRSIIGVVQQGEAYDFTTVEGNFRIYSMLWQIPKHIANDRMEYLIDLFGLDDIRRKRVFELSGGQKKRLQVAREFMHDMKILFLDEPTVGLDPIMRRRVLDFISEKAKDGLTVLFTTQNLEEADYICHRIGIINDGRISAEGTSADLKAKFGSLKRVEILYSSEANDNTVENLHNFLAASSLATSYGVERAKLWAVSAQIGKLVSEIVQRLSSLGVEIDSILAETPSLDDVFMEVVKE